MSKNYTKREILLRVLWSLVNPLFRYSPRLFYAWRNFILRSFGAKIGSNVRIYPSAKITYPWLLQIGDNTVISWNVSVYNLGLIRIGSKTVISQNVHLCGGTHDYSSGNFTLIRCGLTIGDNVWVAADAFIGPNVIIENDVVVASRSVVIKNVKSNEIVGGNPARFIKYKK